MSELTQTIEFVPPAAKPSKPGKYTELWMGLAQFGLVGVAWAITRIWTYVPGNGMGYNLGLVGGVMMLILLVYPLRKRVRFMRNWVNTRPWFVFHMTLGLCGPVLVLAHTRFHVGALNSQVALWSMLLVAGSGIVGRYIYIALHHHHTDQRIGFVELQREAGFHGAEVRSQLAYAPDVEALLHQFEASAQANRNRPWRDVPGFLFIGIRAWMVERRASALLITAIRKQAAVEGWDRARCVRRLTNGEQLVQVYLDRIVRLSRFRTWVRLFSLWHIAHVPLVYALVATAIAHVVAVHMY